MRVAVTATTTLLILRGTTLFEARRVEIDVSPTAQCRNPLQIGSLSVQQEWIVVEDHYRVVGFQLLNLRVQGEALLRVGGGRSLVDQIVHFGILITVAIGPAVGVL